MSEGLKKIEELLANDRKIIEEKNKEIERLQKENKKLKLCLGIVSPSRVLLEGKYWEKEDNEEIERLNNIINELEKDIDNQITFCTNEANGTTNDKYCRIALNYLKHLKDKLLELKRSE